MFEERLVNGDPGKRRTDCNEQKGDDSRHDAVCLNRQLMSKNSWSGQSKTHRRGKLSSLMMMSQKNTRDR